MESKIQNQIQIKTLNYFAPWQELLHLSRKANFYLYFHRVKILKEKALPEIENYMFEEHDQIRQAATECMCNLVCCKDV